MYAVFRTGGKQYRATEGQRLKLERLEAGVGDTVEFDQVLLIGEGTNLAVGAPLVSGGKVSATVMRQGRHRKIDVIKFKRRANYKRQRGHRQWFTEVEITSIAGGPAGAAKASKRKPAKARSKDAAESKPAESTPAESTE